MLIGRGSSTACRHAAGWSGNEALLRHRDCVTVIGIGAGHGDIVCAANDGAFDQRAVRVTPAWCRTKLAIAARAAVFPLKQESKLRQRIRQLAVLAISFGFFVASSNAKADAVLSPYIKSQLSKLTPEEKVEQRCDMEAMSRIDRDHHGLRPDKVIAYSFGYASIKGGTVRAKGAVFRSRSDWYRLRYTCKVRRATLEVRSFDYEIGSKVRKSEWSSHYLYD